MAINVLGTRRSCSAFAVRVSGAITAIMRTTYLHVSDNGAIAPDSQHMLRCRYRISEHRCFS
eukprot:9565297-Alexandrium_andersonii.AAC.1